MTNSDIQFLTGFEWAEVRLATFDQRLLFASVHLLPKGRSKPEIMNGVEKHKLPRKGGTLYFRRTVLTAKDAVKWYRAIEDTPVTPLPSCHTDRDTRFDGMPIRNTKMIDDPIWPTLGLPYSNSLFSNLETVDPAPFIGNTSSRVHRRFGDGKGFEVILNDSSALAFLARRLHIKLDSYPEYLGSTVLLVPDPVISKIDNFVIPNNNSNGDEYIFYRFVPRVGQTLEGLKLITFDERASLLSSFEVLDVPKNGIIKINKGSCIGKYGYVVTHPVHGILAYHQPTGFLRAANVSIGVIGETREVRVPIGESKKASSIDYEVNRISRSNSNYGYDHIPPNVNSRVGTAARARERLSEAFRLDQKWFGKGTRKEAMAFIRQRISRARSRVIIADPYFGILQIPQYLLAITSNDVKIELLTSRLAFESSTPTDEDGGVENFSTSVEAKVRQFNEEVERIKKGGNSDFEVMVLNGKSPELHDRFLVIDDDVWFMGNSLNTLGSRASMVIKLPNPDEVLSALRDFHNKSEKFSDYIKSIAGN
ncbi:TPA: hypothetical protein NJ360_004334 [Vibrio parahaemolyticus]|uniref:VPA1262 family N-terminal domain-containing protein n=1 Tax=Vibrio parahaemolyticus TaxID=670 RepID=UPI000A3B9252|nr:VPA1262 family N-terminal domain-containing protein [Vibrio parahaemolyticus]MDF4703640.1 VPA1262 family N-terminal domain-containing protein [Vibrio parahaemolyticus]OUD51886.1 hypothetical protein BTA15_14480 [Vibrio parahaemolyticus]HCE2222821.1 hypothetical protein [Vibrio parahaemolyticus]HCG7236402.1 hypothetical protein [Vibrio parahaemolyticus]